MDLNPLRTATPDITADSLASLLQNQYDPPKACHSPSPRIRTQTVFLDGYSLTANDLLKIFCYGSERWDGHSHFSPDLGEDVAVELTDIAWQRVRDARKRVEAALESDRPIYGVNTGFGAFCNVVLSKDKLEELQVNLIRSHAAGVGNPLPPSRVKRLLAVRVNVIAKGYSGLREENLRKILRILNADCMPYVPGDGSVGCSGDLAPSAHVALGLMGEGLMWNPSNHHYELAFKVLKEHNLEPIELSAKEGLAMINGTQLIASLGSEAIVRARLLALQADVIAAITMEALRSVPDAFQEEVHLIRGQQGQVDSAERIRLMMHNALDPSELYVHSPHNVQDAYSIRCTPQVHGIALDTLEFVENIIQREINAATDNPLVMEDGRIVSAGNFHGEYPGKALDYLAIGIAELATISERRLERLINTTLSGPSLSQTHHLPPFLMPRESGGLNSGFMIPQCTAAALVSQNKVLCHPSTCDSISTSAAQEDHVSMATYAALKSLEVIENVERVLSIELMAACQALDLAHPIHKSTKRVQEVHRLVRAHVPFWTQDRIAYLDMNNTFRLVREGKILDAAGIARYRSARGGWAAPSNSSSSSSHPPLVKTLSSSSFPAADPPPRTHHRICLHNATLVTFHTDPAEQHRGPTVLKNTSILVDHNGKISHTLPAPEMRRMVFQLKRAGDLIDREVECNGHVVMPGFVDAHTHSVFAGDRSHEMAAKLAGESYQSITSRGGGIHFSVAATRKASERELASSLRKRLDAMLLNGTTTVEVKSGYGLDVETELKMLRVIHAVNASHPIKVISTFCGAHAVPAGSTAEEATQRVICEMLPTIEEARNNKLVSPTLCDVFCDEGFFSVDQTQRILEAAARYGMRGAFHGDELTPQRTGVLAQRVNALSVSHCEHFSDEDIAAMAASKGIAVLLPTTAFLLRLVPPPARKIIDGGVRVALGTDFNPNAPSLSMPLIMNMASVIMRMTMPEVLAAATINAAAALNVDAEVGSIEVGKSADLLLLSVPAWEHIVYLGLGGLGATPVGANLEGLVSSDGGPVISEVIISGVSVVYGGKVQPLVTPTKGVPLPSPFPNPIVGLSGLPDLSLFARGIPLDPLPSAMPHRNPLVPHAPKRPYKASPQEVERALLNALRYFPPHLHSLLAPEFLQELNSYGHIYMYRFMPSRSMPQIKAWPIAAYPAASKAAAAIMLMIMNNLDPDVAQYPEELVTYGGNGSVFSNWAQFWLTMQYLSQLSEDQTLVMYSGHPHGLFPSHPDAPRVVITNGMVVPHYSTTDDYERNYFLGVSQYGQMTAGSYCYIGPQGIVHGTTLTLMNAGRKYLGLNELTGKVYVTSGLGGMSGAQAKAAIIAGAIGVIAEVSEAALAKRHRQGWLSERVDGDVALLVARIKHHQAAGTAVAIGYLGNIVEVWEHLARMPEGELHIDLGSDQTSCHNVYGGGYIPVGYSPEETTALMSDDPQRLKEVVDESLRRQVAAINVMTARGMKFWDYGNSFLLYSGKAGADVFADASHQSFRYPSYVEDIMGDIFSLGFGPFRWVCTSGSSSDLHQSDLIAADVITEAIEELERCKSEPSDELSPATAARLGCLKDNLKWIRQAHDHRLVVGSQARILYTDAAGRAAIARAFNNAIYTGRISGPVVLSRDHHDVSGADSPYRETSDIRDGSKFCADMAIHNAIGGSFRGATWVAIHNGGGTGWGEAINGGFGLVLDGSKAAADRASQFLHWDVFNGITRRAWAGNSFARSTLLQNALSECHDPLFSPTLPYPVKSDLIQQVISSSSSSSSSSPS